MPGPERIREVVDVLPQPTVVRLEDLDRPDAAWLTERYHVTGDVDRHLQALRAALARPAGCGVFVIGAYGCGKSHFLAYVARELAAGRLAAAPPRLATLSLLNFAGAARLEDIVSAALDIPVGHGDRRVAWATLAEKHAAGCVLILDELSEFLRSKPDRAAYSEDIRFLQYLGEWAAGQRFWVIAALQEHLEHTGDLEHAHYRKIKDRYPLRLLLTPAHVRDLVGDSLLRKKPGYAAAAAALARRVRDAMPAGAVDEAALAALAPIHPLTLDLLEEVRGSFSQARGAIDFVLTRLLGDEARAVAPFLDCPWGQLLTPEVVTEHFRDLLHVQSEFRPLAEKVLPYWDRRIGELLREDASRALARRLIDLLVLWHISPARKGLRPEDAVAALLFAPSRTDPQKGVQIVGRILRELAAGGQYLTERGGAFVLDVEDDGAGELERLLAREVAELTAADDVVLEMLLPLAADDPQSPLSLPQGLWQRRALRWHFHERGFSVWLGAGTPPPGAEGEVALCVRLPWGEAREQPAPGTATLLPRRLELDDRLRELLAAVRLAERPLRRDVAARLQKRLADGQTALAARVREVYATGALVLPSGGREAAPPLAQGRLDAWLDQMAEGLLARKYPSFARFAPGHGPLGRESYRAFLRCARDRDLCAWDADEHVRLVREAYLVPMGLLERSGRDYVVPRRLDQKELVRLVMPLLDAQPAPEVVYRHLAKPVFGLVPDQVHLLLLFLLVQGEIDLLSGSQSMRDVFETLPLPIQYDRIVPGRALGLEALRDLERLCEGLGVPVPKQWTVTGQRRATARLAEVAAERAAGLRPLAAKLEAARQGQRLAGDAAQALGMLDALAAVGGDLAAFDRIRGAARSPEWLCTALATFGSLAERIDHTLGETRRLETLLAHDSVRVDAGLAARAADLGPAPDLAEPELVTAWLGRARGLYAEHEERYGARHEAWWATRQAHAAWTWRAPALGRSRHVGLAEAAAEAEAARERATRLRCRGLSSLEFHPICSCGFDGQSAPAEQELLRFAAARDRIETELRLFFRAEAVRARVSTWAAEVGERSEATAEYLAGSRPYPEVVDVAGFDRHLAGAAATRSIPAARLLELLGDRTWDRAGVHEAVDRLLDSALGEGDGRVRLEGASGDVPAELLVWCAERAVRDGVALPAGVAPLLGPAVAERLRVEWIGPAALTRLDDLALGDPLVDGVLGLVADGRAPVPPELRAGDLADSVAAALELREPKAPATPGALGDLTARLYRAHRRMWRVARERWLARLDALAQTVLDPPPPPLEAALGEHGDAQWLVVDALGLPLLGTLLEAARQHLPGWRAGPPGFAQVSARTTTRGFYAELLASGRGRALEKLDAVDALLHERSVAFEDLVRLVEAELAVGLRGIRARLDPGRPVLLLADHGFRLAPDGRSYRHGGASTLERVVPLVRLEVGG